MAKLTLNSPHATSLLAQDCHRCTAGKPKSGRRNRSWKTPPPLRSSWGEREGRQKNVFLGMHTCSSMLCLPTKASAIFATSPPSLRPSAPASQLGGCIGRRRRRRRRRHSCCIGKLQKACRHGQLGAACSSNVVHPSNKRRPSLRQQRYPPKQRVCCILQKTCFGRGEKRGNAAKEGGSERASSLGSSCIAGSDILDRGKKNTGAALTSFLHY